jgi:hypothetical protein
MKSANMDANLSQTLGLASYLIPGAKYGYTAAPPMKLASKNTLALSLMDESYSTKPFARQIELFCKELIKSLRNCDSADELVYMQTHFSTDFRDHHGFTPLMTLTEAMYDGCYNPGGQTHLYDNCVRCLDILTNYSKEQAKAKRLCNGFLYIVTDGRDYGSSLTQSSVREALEKAIASETLESLVTILIGVNDDPDIQRDLKAFQEAVGFTFYQPIAKADATTMSHLTGWVSQQLVSQSQHLGTGGPSQVIASPSLPLVI